MALIDNDRSDVRATPGSFDWLRTMFDKRSALRHRLEQAKTDATGENRSRATVVAEALAHSLGHSSAITPEATAESYAALRQKIHPGLSQGWVPRPRTSRSWPVPALAAAGLVLIAVFAGRSWERGRSWMEHSVGLTASVSTRYVTQHGQRAEIGLVDGTTILLNAGSSLSVPSSFKHGGLGVSQRAVRLRGEAYFRVTHASGVPFTVETGETRTRVLGTEFGVRAYEPTMVQVAVRSGKVSVNGTVLQANDIARVTDTEPLQVAHNQTLDATLAFADGQLIINATLRDVIDDLNRWYDARVQLADPALESLPLRAVLKPGSIDDLAELLHVTFNVPVLRHGRTLTVLSR